MIPAMFKEVYAKVTVCKIVEKEWEEQDKRKRGHGFIFFVCVCVCHKNLEINVKSSFLI